MVKLHNRTLVFIKFEYFKLVLLLKVDDLLLILTVGTIFGEIKRIQSEKERVTKIVRTDIVSYDMTQQLRASGAVQEPF